MRQAYLAYSAASIQELDQLSLDPIRPYLTDAGANQEQESLNGVEKTGFRYRETLTHNPQIVVYSGGQLASVDDVLNRTTTPLDETTNTSTGAKRSDVFHLSVALRFGGGKWLVDSAVPFGSDAPEDSLPISYAASSSSPPQALAAEVRRSYQQYWDALAKASTSLDPTGLADIEFGPQLGKDTSNLSMLRQNGQGYKVQVQHNLRIAVEDPTTMWIYDTFADNSYRYDLGTRKAVPAGPTAIIRASYEFQLTGQTWKLARSGQYQ